MDEYALETLALHAGEEPDPQTGALRLPLHMATSFKLPGFGRKLFDALLMESDRPPHAYSRWSNPTLRALEERMTALEGGQAAVATATGMAAVNTVYYTLLSQGDHVVCTEALYGPSRTVLETEYSRFGIEATFVDSSVSANVENAMLMIAGTARSMGIEVEG